MLSLTKVFIPLTALPSPPEPCAWVGKRGLVFKAPCDLSCMPPITSLFSAFVLCTLRQAIHPTSFHST